MVRKAFAVGVMFLSVGLVVCGGPEVPEQGRDIRQDIGVGTTEESPPPGRAGVVDEALARFAPWSAASHDGGKTLVLVRHKDGGSEGFLLWNGQVFYHPAWKDCPHPTPGTCDLSGAQLLDVPQMERLLRMLEDWATRMGPVWDLAHKSVDLLRRSIASGGQPWPPPPAVTLPTPEEVDAALASFVPMGYTSHGGGARILVTSLGREDGFLVRSDTVLYTKQWQGCTPETSAATCDASMTVALSQEQLRVLAPVLEARAARLGWDLAYRAVELVHAALEADSAP